MSLTINHQTNDISASSGSMTIDGAAAGGLTYASTSGPSSNQTFSDNAGGYTYSSFAWSAISSYGYVVAQTSAFSTSDISLVNFRLLLNASAVTSISVSGTGYISGGFTIYRGIPSGSNTQTKVSTDASGTNQETITTSTTAFQNALTDKTSSILSTPLEANEVLWVLMRRFTNDNRQGSWRTNANGVSIETWS